MAPNRPARGAWAAVGGVGIVLLAIVAGIAFVIGDQLSDSRDREIRQVAVQRAQLANELGTALPSLTSEKISSGLTPIENRAISEAENRLRKTQPLLGISIFDRRRRLVYPSGTPVGLRLPAGMTRALAGTPSVERLHNSGDPVLEASVPIRDLSGTVTGVLAVALDENGLREVSENDKDRVLFTLLAAAALLWLVLLPISLRLARLAAPYLSADRWRVRRGLADALAHGGVELHYLPKVEVEGGVPCAAEALVRWRRNGTLLSPGEFLPHVEQDDLVRDLTDFVLDRALADARRWRAAGHELGVAVNLLSRNLEDDELPDRVAALLAKHGLSADLLTLEVTENAVLTDPARVEAVLTRLAGLGATLSIDDFGTGHSSLERLQRFPIGEVKIDRMFVARITQDERPFVDAIAHLGTALGLDVVAEGVEDQATLDLVAQSGCVAAQGFFFCRPVPVDELLGWLSAAGAAT